MTEFEKLKNKTTINNIVLFIGAILSSPIIILTAFFMTFSSLKLAFNVSPYTKWRDLLWNDYYVIRNVWVLFAVSTMFSGSPILLALVFLYLIRSIVVDIKDKRNGAR